MGARSRQDEELLRLIGMCNSNPKNVQNTVLIHDSRPYVNALANRAKGGGVEDCGAGNHYPNCKLKFADIENIHEVSKVYKNLLAFAYQADRPKDTQAYLIALDKTDYRIMLQMILIGVNDVLDAMTKEPFENVLVHCSDGWDRTSQISSLVQLLLDPYYRTLEGFQVLIEKDWLSFGHMFGRRCGHFTNTDTGNRSPVFMQWLDAVHQIWHQMPSLFEFNVDLLLFIAENLYNCKYGTFLLNNPNERMQTKTSDNTLSIWVEINLRRKEFQNSYYLPIEEQPQQGRMTRIPKVSYKDMRIWREYYFKLSEDSLQAIKGDPHFLLDKKTCQQRELTNKLEQLMQRSEALLQKVSS